MIIEKVKTDAVVEPDGAVKWKTNGSYLMDDLCEQLDRAGFEFSWEATRQKRAKQTEERIREYCQNHKGPTEEELSEMQSVFGKGTTVVDVISNEEITL